MPTPKKWAISPLWLAALCLWGVLLYSNTLHVPFVYDDDRFIVKNHFIQTFPDDDLWQTYKRRYVPFVSFALNYRLHGTDVAGYHAINLAVHVANGLLVVWLVLLLFETKRILKEKIYKHRHVIAFLSGWLFLSHPVQTQAVTYITQRCESMAALFYILTLCLYLKGRLTSGKFSTSVKFYFLSGVAALLGMFSKETAFTLPVSIALAEWLFFKPVTAEANKNRWLFIEVLFLLCAFAAYVFSFNLKILHQFERIGISSKEYFFTQFEVILNYLRLLFVPLSQNLDYNLPLSTGVLNSRILLSLSCVLLILIIGIRLCRNHPLIGFGVLWFFITLSVTSSIVPLPDVMVEHRLYLPSMGFVIALCTALFSFIGAKYYRLLSWCLVGLIFTFSLLTYQRNALWNDDVALWQDVASKSPASSRIYNNLGECYRRRGAYQEAANSYELALKYEPASPEIYGQIYVNLGSAYGKLGKHQKEIESCLKAIELLPTQAWVYSHMAFIYNDLKDYENALRYGRKAVELHPGLVEGWNNIGVTYAGMGRYEEAIKYFKKALEYHANYKLAKDNLALAEHLIREASKQSPTL